MVWPMRRLAGLLMVVALVACDADFDTIAAPVQWLEWPQEVVAGHAFKVRVVVWPSRAPHVSLRATPQLGDTAITFTPVWRYDHSPSPPVGCEVNWKAVSDTVSIPGAPLTTLGHDAMVTVAPGPAGVPQATDFGDLVVRSDSADTSRAGAAGFVKTSRVSGCTGIQQPGAAPYVIENPPDTASSWSGFVSGYLYRPDALVCRASRVFHLVRTN